MNEQQLQVLRTIDKVDKIGIDGVVDLLQHPLAEAGAGLMPHQAEMIRTFLSSQGADSAETLANVALWLQNAGRVRHRIDLMALLEETPAGDAGTAWDQLLNMRQNADQTWADGARPANIAWALDDMIDWLTDRKRST